MQSALKCNERWRIWVHGTFKIEIQKGGPNISNIRQNWFPPQKLGALSLISRNFKDLRKILMNHAEYIEMQWTMKNLGLENF